MGKLLFTNLPMLAGLAALALPILIHLLLKRKKQRLRFSTLRFFMRHDEHSSQRRKLRNFLLLAVRLLLLAVLVTAFARPFLPNNEAGAPSQKKRLAVLIIDRSASMQASDAGSLRWPRAREAMLKILGELTPNDRAALIACARRSEILSGAAPPAQTIRLVKDLQPGYGTANLGEALQLAGKIIFSAGAASVSTIYVISDLQLSGCLDLQASPLPPTVEVKPIKIGDVLSPNLAVTELHLDGRDAERPYVTLANFSDDHMKEAKVRLMIDGKEVSVRPVSFLTGNVARAEFQLPRFTPGWHSGLAQVEGVDGFALDNIRHEAFFVPRPLRTLIIETRSGRRVFEEESFFLMSALDPMVGSTNGNLSRFVLEKLSSENFLTQPLNYDLVIVPGLKKVPNGLGGKLLEFVRAGGGLALFLNDEVDLNGYNRELRELLPAQPGHIERNTFDLPGAKWHLEDYQVQDPMFAAFRRPGSGNLSLPEFSRRFTLATNQASLTSAQFEDGTPAIVRMTVGSGKVVLINCSADTEWTDWPKHKTYVPWLHHLCLSLAPRAEGEQIQYAPHWNAGEEHDVPPGVGAKPQAFNVQKQGEKKAALIADRNGHPAGADFSNPGIYSITNQAGKEMQRIVVNIPREESDLSALTAVEFQRKLTHTPAAEKSPLAATLFGSDDHQKDLARLLLMIGLGLLFAETLLANRTYA